MSRTSRSRPGSEASPSSPPRSSSAPKGQSSRSRPPKATSAERSVPSGVRSTSTNGASTVPDGIAFHTRILRTYGLFAGLVYMAVSGLASIILLWGSQSTLRGVIGFVLAVMSCPTLPLFGFPVSSSGSELLIVIASSAALWIALGYVAVRRSTSRAVAGWPEWRKEWLRLAIGVWIGSLLGFAVAAILLTIDF